MAQLCMVCMLVAGLQTDMPIKDVEDSIHGHGRLAVEISLLQRLAVLVLLKKLRYLGCDCYGGWRLLMARYSRP